MEQFDFLLMNPEKNVQGRLNTFFNARAEAYVKNVFVDYLFSRREEAALGDDTLAGYTLLDFGCGTGRLYAYFRQNRPAAAFQYLGLDPAGEMLAASPIPENERRVGDVSALRPEDGSFDRIYLLGVTTYLPDEVLVSSLAKLAGRLTENGRLVVHFTNANSLEVRLRQWLRPLLRRLTSGRHVASGGFDIYPRSMAQVDQFPLPLALDQIRKLPATLPFLQHLSPRLAVWLSRRISRRAPDALRMDFIVTYRRAE